MKEVGAIVQESAKILEPLNTKLSVWKNELIAILPNLILALGIAVLFFFLSKTVRKGGEKFFLKLSHGNKTISRIFAVCLRIVVLLIGLFIALSLLGLDKAVLSLIAGAGVLGLALGFAFQDLAQNFIAGFILMIKKPFSFGDAVEVAGELGVVKAISLRTTVINTFDGLQKTIPNKDVFQKIITNYNGTGKRRVGFEVGVSYDADLEVCTNVIKKAIQDLGFTLEDQDVLVVLKAFGESSINFMIRYWIPVPGDVSPFEAVHLGIISVKKALDAQGIQIPFPIRTLDFSSSSEKNLAINMYKK